MAEDWSKKQVKWLASRAVSFPLSISELFFILAVLLFGFGLGFFYRIVKQLLLVLSCFMPCLSDFVPVCSFKHIYWSTFYFLYNFLCFSQVGLVNLLHFLSSLRTRIVCVFKKCQLSWTLLPLREYIDKNLMGRKSQFIEVFLLEAHWFYSTTLSLLWEFWTLMLLSQSLKLLSTFVFSACSVLLVKSVSSRSWFLYKFTFYIILYILYAQKNPRIWTPILACLPFLRTTWKLKFLTAHNYDYKMAKLSIFQLYSF